MTKIAWTLAVTVIAATLVIGPRAAFAGDAEPDGGDAFVADASKSDAKISDDDGFDANGGAPNPVIGATYPSGCVCDFSTPRRSSAGSLVLLTFALACVRRSRHRV